MVGLRARMRCDRQVIRCRYLRSPISAILIFVDGDLVGYFFPSIVDFFTITLRGE